METLLTRMANAATLFAEGAGGGDGASARGADSFAFFLPLIAIVVLFYFLMIRPQRQERTRRQQMLDAVKKNDRVVTIGGVYGVVTNVRREADEVTVKVDESTNTKLRLTLSSIARIVGEDASDESAQK
jgi:preprotein translocase subunit YajC